MILTPAKPRQNLPGLVWAQSGTHAQLRVAAGLSAELIRNRKFAGMPQQRTGVSQDWYRLDPEQAWHLVELPPHRWDPGTTGLPYTRHFGAETNASSRRTLARLRTTAHRNFRNRRARRNRSIKQLAPERRRSLRRPRRVAVRPPAQAKVAILGESPRALAKSRPSPAMGGTRLPFSFVAPKTDENASIEITFDQPGVLYVGGRVAPSGGSLLRRRADVVALLKEISTPLLRWPGGNFADNYYWKDGLLTVDQRAALALPRNLPHARLRHARDRHRRIHRSVPRDRRPNRSSPSTWASKAPQRPPPGSNTATARPTPNGEVCPPSLIILSRTMSSIGHWAMNTATATCSAKRSAGLQAIRHGMRRA